MTSEYERQENEEAAEPRYTWKSMFALAAFSVVAVWALYAVFEVRDTVLRTWDFHRLSLEDAEWQFPSEGLAKTSTGITFTAREGENGVRLDGLELDTASVGAVRIRMRMTDVASGESVAPRAELYWATAGDIESANGKWPYNAERGCGFNLLDRKKPDTLTAEAANWKKWGNKKWDGTVTSLCIRIAVPQSCQQGCRVDMQRIELVTQHVSPPI